MQQEPFDPTDFERIPTIVPWIAKVHPYVSIESTNDEASKRARAGAPEGTVVVADHQTAGRGRLGRSWISEPGLALLASWIIRPPASVNRSLLALASGVAVANAIEAESTIDVSLKWPNDIMVGSRKLAGILAEAIPDGSVVVGVGVNVRTSEFPAGIGPATSLLLEGSRPIGRARLLTGILQAMSASIHAPATTLEEYRRRCTTIGSRVQVTVSGGKVEGVATAVGNAGELILQTAHETLHLRAGDIVHLR